MTLDSYITDLVEKAVARAFDARAIPAFTTAPADPGPAPEKKPRAKKAETSPAPAETPAPAADVVTTEPLPAPAAPPTVAATAPADSAESAEADQAKVRALIPRIPGGAAAVRDEIAKVGGGKFVDLPPASRVIVLAELVKLAAGNE